MTYKTKGIIALLIASLGFAFMSIFVKLAGDLPFQQKVVFRNSISMIISFIMVNRTSAPTGLKSKNLPLLILRSSLGTVGMLLFFYSIDNLDITSDAQALNKLSSFFLIAFSFIFLREKVRLSQIIAILIAFVGALLIIKPSFNQEMFPYVTSILAAMCAGGAYTILRALGNHVKFYAMVLFFSSFSVLILLPWVILTYVPMSLEQIFYMVLTGLAATVGQFGTTLAYKYAPAKDISIFNFSNLVFVALIAIPVLGEFPDYISIIGYIVIFSASYYMFKFNK